ncbi:hypothetical protein MTZ49_10815 [Entomomonas sp. E2T0]|uniref:hypothetical protein n=1 Tax=Entomomonas sp. E2T0 TaxID=2930213 RepID=UPI0022284722|nr:hypothetical protein [Entomomonas sp. E2T0]UYZ83093.1 hypothetical protein MTZ49_10815 [Entomomonas sp. E2T0]
MKDILNKLCNFLDSKPFIYTSIALLWLFIAYQTYSRDNLSDQIKVQQNQLTELNERISNDKEQINVLVRDGQSTYKTVKEMEKTVVSLSRRTDEVQQYQLDQALNQKREDDNRPSFEDLSTLQNQMSTLQFQLKDLNQRVYELNKTNITAAINKQHQTSPLSITVDSPAIAQQKKPVVKTLVPPFSVLGIESRGGELFVSVAPSKSYSLNQIKLLRTGDSYRSWQLKSIRTNAVVFNVGTRQQVITIR